MKLLLIPCGPPIRPLLLKAYLGATEAELLEAHSYAYGGCLVEVHDTFVRMLQGQHCEQIVFQMPSY